MPTASTGLRELHQLHLELADVRERLDRGPKKIAAAQRRTARREAEIGEQKERLQQARKMGDQKSLQMKSHEQKIVELKVRLNQCSTNREFDLIKSQIEADEMAQSVLEDEILETYEKLDEIQQKIGDLEEAVREDRAEEQRVSDQVASAESGLREEEETLIGQLYDAEKIIPGVMMDRYRRLVQAHGPGALAPVEGDVCGACFVSLEPQSRVEVNSGKIVFCRHCGRMLYPAEGGE